ncbi:MAG: bifunctional diaminohydroxyphosphoribosylaminopyrimidine deaminase/5-amino-6-(5-phosphoribosylamino)uracil reductase RibD, partial [Nitrospira sp.]|nr:bifunctional diaminohydroxyphosphoribosylaminopyrimidine deaminase/5-amino-6-(5-phosphoribosylamino)uracil reductase RibD [Nitrospira sp.]
MGQDRRYMWRSLELARNGRAYVAPNPMCGAVVVRDGAVVGEGFHERLGGPHAEAQAIESAGEKARGATLYVTLEPCCNTYEGKRTPPCVPEIVKAGIARVVIANADPHPEVSGQGVKALAEAGIEVQMGECEEEAAELNAAYFSHVRRGRPLVTAKWAMTMDGKIATRRGDARWISSDEAQREVHYDRSCSGAVIVGIGTVLADNPMLNARTKGGRQPLRVVVDPKLQIPANSKLVESAKEFPLAIYTRKDNPSSVMKALQDMGAELIALEHDGHGHLGWGAICRDLGYRGINSAIVEGGGGLLATAFKTRAVDRVKIYIAPKIFGGKAATTPVEGPGIPDVERAITFSHIHTRMLGP